MYLTYGGSDNLVKIPKLSHACICIEYSIKKLPIFHPLCYNYALIAVAKDSPAALVHNCTVSEIGQ